MHYRTATKLYEEDGAVQVSCLVYAMGNESENIFSSFVFTDAAHENDFDRVTGSTTSILSREGM